MNKHYYTEASPKRAPTFQFPLLGVMFLIFMTLKLTNHIDWSWWLVTAPLWGGFAVVAILFVGFMIFVGVGALVSKVLK